MQFCLRCDRSDVFVQCFEYRLRACEFGWVKQLVNEWDGSRQLLWLPNVAYSLAYAEYQLAVTERPDPSAADLTKADEALQRAIVQWKRFCYFVFVLCSDIFVPFSFF